MKDESEMSLEELQNLKEEKMEIDKGAFEVNEGICKDCREKLIKKVENINLFSGAVTFHIIKLKCPKCNKEYLDLDQAEKYDFLLALEKVSREKPLEVITKSINA